VHRSQLPTPALQLFCSRQLVQAHAFLPHVHAPDDLGAQLQVLVQLLLLELQLRHIMADAHTIDERYTAATQGTRFR
jgi:hypothetical protein